MGHRAVLLFRRSGDKAELWLVPIAAGPASQAGYRRQRPAGHAAWLPPAPRRAADRVHGGKVDSGDELVFIWEVLDAADLENRICLVPSLVICAPGA
jgi:hypothetical protein